MTSIAFGTAPQAPRLRHGAHQPSLRHGAHQPSLRHGAHQPSLRLTKRGRAVFGTLAAIPVIAVAVFLGFDSAAATGDAGSGTFGTGTFEYVSIAPGQSLWQLAEQVAPQADPREVVADILSLNNLTSGDVQPGQELAIPAQYAS